MRDVSSQKARQLYSERNFSALELIKQLTFSPNCQYLAIKKALLFGIGDATSIMILDMNSENRIVHFRVANFHPIIDALITFSPDSMQLAAYLTFGDTVSKTTGVEIWNIASASTAHVLTISDDYFMDFMSSQMSVGYRHDAKGSYFSPSIMSFSDNNHLSLTSIKRPDGSNPSFNIRVILTIKHNSNLEVEKSNEILLLEESHAVIYLF